jgi:regulatory protein
MEPDPYKILLKKAGNLLARRAYSRGDLRIKLAKISGEPSVDKVLDRLEQLNLLNDVDYAYNFALCRIRRRGWGHAKVYQSLLRHLVARATIESAIDRVRNEVDDNSVLIEYLQRRFAKRGLPKDRNGVRKLALHLQRRGFDERNIWGVLKQMIPAVITQQFGTGE